MKKLTALLLVAILSASLLAACGNSQGNTDSPGIPTDTYTYHSYCSSLGTNWNPHNWETDTDGILMGYMEAPLVEVTVLNSTSGEYQWIFVAATDIQDVTADHQEDLSHYQVELPAGISDVSQVTEGYIYEIKLRPEMLWQDGTQINADTYLYSMQQLLDPNMKNSRASQYFAGNCAVAGGKEYYFSNDEGLYASVYTLYESVDAAVAAGETVYLDMHNFCGLNGAQDADGNACPQWVPITDTVAYQNPADGSWISAKTIYDTYAPYGHFSPSGYPQYVSLYTANEALGASWNGVGLYKVDDLTIRYVCRTSCDYYQFLNFCTSNWIVHEELYESCKVYNADGIFQGNQYGTSLATTMSCGPYRLTALEEQKQAVLTQNETYWEYTKDSNGNLYSETFFEVDGAKQPQYFTQKIILDVMDDTAAKQAFLSGKLDQWHPSAEDAVTFSSSEQLYRAEEVYLQRLFFHTNLDSLKDMDASGGNRNSVVLSNDTFRKAMSLAIDRNNFVTATAGFQPAFAMLNSLYFYDVYGDPASIYRNTDEAMQAICNVYGIAWGEGTPYKTLEEAYRSVSGYDPAEAKALFTQACQELVAAGLYTEGQPIKIQTAWMAGSHDFSSQKQIVLLNQSINQALEGTGFGTIELIGIDQLPDRYEDVINGNYAIGFGAWAVPAFAPFRYFQVYCDADHYQLHESGCWTPASELLTLPVADKEITMTWQQWSNSMVGTGLYADASNEVKLQILAGMEENFMKKYYTIPLCSTTSVSMLSYKISNYTPNYSMLYGFGGIRLMKYNYTNTAWAEFVAAQGGNLDYE